MNRRAEALSTRAGGPTNGLPGLPPADPHAALHAELMARLSEPEVSLLGADILVLSPTPTAPTDQGNRKRIYAVCRELQRRGARIHFVFYPQEWWFDYLPDDLVREMADQWDSFHLLPATRHTYTRPEGADYKIDEWWDDSIRDYLQWLFKRNRFDAFIVNYAYMSKAFEYAPANTLKILDTHDKFTGRRQLLDDNGIAPEFFYTTEDQEAIAMNRAQLVWAIKDEEAEFYRSISSTPCITMPHIEPEHRVPRVRRPEDENRLVIGMLGSGNAINVNNARAFVKVALPILARREAPVVIRFVGAMCSRLPDLEGIPGVELMGPVDSTDEFYRDVDLVIVPLAFSTGLKIKAVEAFATGMPLVAMGHALEGIPTRHPWHKCETMEEVAEVCCDIAFDRQLLAGLTETTTRTYALVRAQAKIAFDDTLRRLTNYPTVVMTVDRSFFELDSPYREHIFQTVNLMRHLAQVVLYFDQPLPTSQNALFEAFHGMSTHCKLAIAPGLEPANGRSLGLPSVQAGLQDVLAAYGRATLWVTRVCPEMLTLGKQPARLPLFVRLDVVRMFQPTMLGSAMSHLTAQFHEATLIDSHPLAAPVPAADHARLTTVPFWRWRPWLLNNEGGPQRVLLLARADQVELADVLAHALDKFHPDWAPARVVVGEPDAGASLPAPQSPRERLQAAALLARFRLMRPLPLAVLDLSGDAPEFEVFRETFRRAQVPVIQPEQGDGNPDQISLWQLTDLVMTLGQNLARWTDQAQREEKARYGSDAGWNHIWKSISVKNVLW
ncbi:glycosyltransferase [Ideonella sp.]|uniref:glycosyltransferase n=1 Tax=Ideonella sp. TaxID=1929293 RepID=UPI0035B23D2A